MNQHFMLNNNTLSVSYQSHSQYRQDCSLNTAMTFYLKLSYTIMQSSFHFSNGKKKPFLSENLKTFGRLILSSCYFGRKVSVLNEFGIAQCIQKMKSCVLGISVNLY